MISMDLRVHKCTKISLFSVQGNLKDTLWSALLNLSYLDGVVFSCLGRPQIPEIVFIDPSIDWSGFIIII